MVGTCLFSMTKIPLHFLITRGMKEGVLLDSQSLSYELLRSFARPCHVKIGNDHESRGPVSKDAAVLRPHRGLSKAQCLSRLYASTLGNQLSLCNRRQIIELYIHRCHSLTLIHGRVHRPKSSSIEYGTDYTAMNHAEWLKVFLRDINGKERATDVQLLDVHGQKLEIRTLIRNSADLFDIGGIKSSHVRLLHVA